MIKINKLWARMRRKAALVSLLGAALLFLGPLTFLHPVERGEALAQTGPPPPPVPTTIAPPSGAEVIEPSVPAIAPPGVPPLVDSGVIAIIPPSSERAVAMVGFTLSENCPATLIIPADPTQELSIRVQHLPLEELTALNELPAPLPSAGAAPLFAFTLNVYTTATPPEEINIHEPPLTVGTCPLPVDEPEIGMLLRYNETGDRYEFPAQQYEPGTKTLRADLAHTSIFVVAAGPATDLPLPAIPTPVIPAGLPRTGGGPAGSGMPLLWASLALFCGLATGVGLWLWRAAHRSKRTL